jgi:hypothetical protein
MYRSLSGFQRREKKSKTGRKEDKKFITIEGCCTWSVAMLILDEQARYGIVSVSKEELSAQCCDSSCPTPHNPTTENFEVQNKRNLERCPVCNATRLRPGRYCRPSATRIDPHIQLSRSFIRETSNHGGTCCGRVVARRPDQFAARPRRHLGPARHQRDHPQWRPLRPLLQER